MKYYTIDKFAIVILPDQMSKPAKASKSLFNSFTRIHRMATLGAVCVAAWFSAQFLQISPGPAADEMMAQDGAQESSLKMAEPEAMMQSVPMEPLPVAEPAFDFFWPIVTVLSVIVVGLVIEIFIKSKKEKSV